MEVLVMKRVISCCVVMLALVLLAACEREEPVIKADPDLTVENVQYNEPTPEVEFIVEGDVLILYRPHSYPNPSSGSTVIVFGLSRSARISIRIYDFTTANLVTTIVEDEVTKPGERVEFHWDGTTQGGDGDRVANGAYLCEVVAETDNETICEIFNITLLGQ